jgi:Zn-dependent peptidase ImmA (M78 family)
LTLGWAVAHRMAMLVANQAHRDTGVARDEYVDVFAALRAAGVCCLAKPLHNMAGAYAAPELGGPVVLLSSNLDEITMRHTAAHELGHHVFGHGSKMDERVDPDGGGLGGSWPEEEKLAEAFAPWFLMPLPAVRRAIQRAGIGRPTAPEDVHQLACWLGTTYAGTARHLVNLQMITPGQASALVRSWRAGSQRVRAALCGSAGPPPGRIWMIRAEASQAVLHVLPGDTLVYRSGELPEVLPPGLAVRSDPQLSLDPRAAVTVTAALTQVTALIIRSADGDADVAVTLIPRPDRSGIDSAWRPPMEPAEAGTEAI